MKNSYVYIAFTLITLTVGAFANSLRTGENVGDPFAWVPASPFNHEAGITVEADIKPAKLTDNGKLEAVACRWHGQAILCSWAAGLKTEGGNVYLVFAIASATGGQTFHSVQVSGIEEGKGYTVKYVYSPGSVAFYLNGELVGTVPTSNVPRPAASAAEGYSIGYFDNNVSHQLHTFDGCIDNLSISDSAGTTIGNWTFDSGSLADTTGNHVGFQPRGTSFCPDFTVEGGGNTGPGDGNGGGDNSNNGSGNIVAELQAQVAALQAQLTTCQNRVSELEAIGAGDLNNDGDVNLSDFVVVKDLMLSQGVTLATMQNALGCGELIFSVDGLNINHETGNVTLDVETNFPIKLCRSTNLRDWEEVEIPNISFDFVGSFTDPDQTREYYTLKLLQGNEQ